MLHLFEVPPHFPIPTPQSMGNLAYDDLSLFLEMFAGYVRTQGKRETARAIMAGAHKIGDAWKHSAKYMNTPEAQKKHPPTQTVFGLSNQEIAKIFWESDEKELYTFLVGFSEKFEKDGAIDKANGRKKLSDALFDASKEFQKAYQALEKETLNRKQLEGIQTRIQNRIFPKK